MSGVALSMIPLYLHLPFGRPAVRWFPRSGLFVSPDSIGNYTYANALDNGNIYEIFRFFTGIQKVTNSTEKDAKIECI